MLPYIYLGQIKISSYLLMLGIGAFCIVLFSWKRRSYYKLTAFQIIVYMLLAIGTGLIAGKAMFAVLNPEHFAKHGLFGGGITVFGPIFLYILIIPPLGKAFAFHPKDSLDLCSLNLSFLLGCQRIGCFLSGCCGGQEVCIGNLCFLWPTQAIESIGDFVIFVYLLQMEENGKRRGHLYPTFLLLYGALRFVVEFLRDDLRVWHCLSIGHLMSVAAILIGSVWLAVGKINGKVDSYDK